VTTVVPLAPGKRASSPGTVLTTAPGSPLTDTDTESITSSVLDTSRPSENGCPGDAVTSLWANRARMRRLFYALWA
jgi:hypothetical protein